MTRKLIWLVGSVMLTAALLLPPVAAALPPNEVETYYYDNNGNEIGWMFRGCDGTRLSTGVTSGTKMIYSEPCETQDAAVTCYYNASAVSCAIQLFWDLCVPHWGEELCSP